MKKRSSSPTMKDVAKEAGVALGTVSKVVNGMKVQDEYKKKVDDAIQKLGYQVNSYAQALKTNKTYTIAFVIPNTHNPYFAWLTHYVNLALLKRGYKMFLCCTDADINQEQEYLSMVEQKKVDGIIGLTFNPNLIINPNIPYVSVDRCLGPSIPCVSCDNFSGGQLAAIKLHELGCKKAAFLRKGSSLNNEPNKRKAGFENGCLITGLPYESLILDDEDDVEDFRKFLIEHIHDGVCDFDGIFCVTDYIATIICKMLKELGQRVPEDIQVIGFDGIRVFDGYACSTIEQPCEAIAEMCVEILFQEKTSFRPPLICLPVTYRAGGTTRD